MDCSSSSYLSILNTSNQKACLTALVASSMQVKWRRGEEEKKNEKQLLSLQLNEKIMILSVPDSVISSSNASNGTVKAMDEIQHFLSEAYKKSLKWSTESYFRKQ
jgi:hypothetical protein